MNKTRQGVSEQQRRELVEAIKQGSSYRLAYEDQPLLNSDSLRPVRLQLELLKPEEYLKLHNIRSTIVVFGSARTLPPDEAARQVEELEAQYRADPGNAELGRELACARKRLDYSRYYQAARDFGDTVSRHFQEERRRDFVVVTGGGPGIMEAANRGAFDIGARSIGLNITLPHEQEPNPFITPELCFQFRYFALRKMHFLLRAKALVAFPGGYGTLDELFEALTLVQTGKIKPIPVVLVGEAYWRKAVNFEFLVEEGMISRRDAQLFSIVDSAEQAVEILKAFYHGMPPE